MTKHELWAQEERLWLEGTAAYRDLVDERCIMAFVEAGRRLFHPVGWEALPHLWAYSENIHGFDERVRISSVKKITGANALFIAEWCGLVSTEPGAR